MRKEDLIFDWRKSESSGKDKFFAVVIVGLLFAGVMGGIELSLSSRRDENEEAGGLIRLVDDEMARTWALVAEENGPFPGRLETQGELGGDVLSADSGLAIWTDYEVQLRPLREDDGMGRVEITPKGKRIFPAVAARSPSALPGHVAMRSAPILIPYDAVAQDWMPAELPAFEMPAGAEAGSPDSPRFAISLREDGSVAEVIPMGGGLDPAQVALENWLRGVRFAGGVGERWFGLRVDFVNRREDGADPE